MRLGVLWRVGVFGVMLLGAPGGHSQNLVASESVSSSSDADAELPDAPEMALVRREDRSGVRVEYQTNIRRFSHLALAVNIGLNGIGVEAATPLSNKWNLRAGASFLGGTYTFKTSSSGAASSFGATLSSDAIDVIFQPHFKSAMVSADWFPRYGGFRVSPGLTLYNGNRATILATVEGGQTIDVGSGTYVSDPSDPIRAALQTKLGKAVAPRLTVGWGNMIPREGRHLSFPFEIGVEYVGRPRITLGLTGSECDSDGLCYPVSVDPGTQANIVEEQKELNGDIRLLQFYPIVSTGVSWRF